MTPWGFTLGDNNVWALRLHASEGGGWLLIDAGFDADFTSDLGETSTWEDLLEQMLYSPVDPADVNVVVVTHEHVDHAGLADAWAGLDARIVVGRAGIATLALGREASDRVREVRLEEYRRNGAPEEVLAAVRGVHPTRTLRWDPCPADALERAEDRSAFCLADSRTLRLIPAPGHTPGNLVALIEETGELFSGDTVLATTIPTPGLHFPGVIEGGDDARWPSLPPFLRSVRAIRELDVSRIYPGHGHVIDDPAAILDRFEAHHAKRAATVRSALHSLGEATAFEVTRKIFRRLPDARLGQAMTEVIGHLDLLEETGAAEPVSEEPRRYRLIAQSSSLRLPPL